MEAIVTGATLARNRVDLVKNLEPPKYWNYLYQEGVFDSDDVDDVKAERTRKRQAEAMLEKLERLPPAKLAVFCTVLNQIQPHLSEMLQREPPPEQRPHVHQAQSGLPQPSMREVRQHMTGLHVHTQPRPFVRKALSPTEHGHGDDCQPSDENISAEKGASGTVSQSVPPNNEEPLFIAPTDLSKIPAHIHPNSEEVYPMNSKPRGIALIINIEFFVPSNEKTKKELEREQLDNRQGSEKDLKALARLFEALDFKVKTNRNLKKSDVLKVLDDVAVEDHSAYDCFVLCLMSHGKEGEFFCADGETILLEDVTNFFSNSQCTTLKGKPKLFFIQACRGNVKEKGVVKDSPNSPGARQPSTVDDNEEKDRGFNFSFPQVIIPDHADILMAYSTVSGFASFRNPLEGSRFVRCLVDVFTEKSSHEDVLSMLTMVNAEIGKMGQIDTKQVGQPTSTLTKKVYFWPGL